MPSIKIFDVPERYKSFLFRSILISLEEPSNTSFFSKLIGAPDKEIKSLINWLGWEWNESYLSPHLNGRAVYTASDIQIRSPINSKSIRGWKNYKQILQASIKMLTQTAKHRDLL